MVRGFNNVDPIWQLALAGSQIDPSWAKAPQVSFAEPVANMAKQFQAGLDYGDQRISRKTVGGQLQDIAKGGGPAAQLLGLGSVYGSPVGGTGTDPITAERFNTRSVPTFSQGGAGGEAKTMPSGTFWSPENRQAIVEEATAAGLNPEDLATVMSYETGGTLDPWKKGPTTKWGTHRGLIQWGEPQAQQYGVTPETPFRDQVKASIKYLQDKGLRPGMGMLEMYSAINAGGIGPEYYGRSDTAAGGAPGTVADKVNNQMGGHRRRVQAWLGQNAGMPAPGQVVQPAPGPVTATAAAQPPVPATAPTSVQAQAREVLARPDDYDPRTVEWARANVGNQQVAQPAASPQLAPSPNDREIAAEVTRNQIETQKSAQGPRPPTFMGMPTQVPGGNVNPTAPLMGGQGQDILMGGSGQDVPAAAVPPRPASAPPAAAAAPPPAAAAAPPMRSAPQYRAPIREAGGLGVDPRILQALGTAIAGGDPNTIAGVQSLIQAGSRGGRGKISLEQLPDGSTVLVDQETGEVSPYSASPGFDAKNIELREVNGQLVEYDKSTRQFRTLPVGGGTKAPETRDVNGVTHQWNGQQWVPIQGGAQPGSQFRLVTPADTEERQRLNIDPQDKRTYQIDTRTGKADPVNEQRAVDDKTFQQETNLREKYETITKDQRAAQEAYSRIQASVADIQESGPTPASDMGLVFGLMKMYDPTSVVRETEYANAQNAGSAPERVYNVYNKVLEGTILTPAQRADFVRQAYNLQRENVKLHNGQAKRFQKLAQNYGLRPEMVAEVWEDPGDVPTRAEVREEQRRGGNKVNDAGEVEVVSEQAAEKLPKGTVVRFTAGPLKGKRFIVE